MSQNGDLSAPLAAYREAIKWVAAAFAGVAALVIGAAPLSQIGKQALSPALLLQLGLLLAALFLLALAVRLCLWLLSPQAVYRSDLFPETGSASETRRQGRGLRFGLGQREDFERWLLGQVLIEIDAHVGDLLPLDCANRQALADKLAAARKEVLDAENKTVAGREFARLSRAAAGIQRAATFLRMQTGVRLVEWPLFLLGAAALLLLMGAGLMARDEAKGPEAAGAAVQMTQLIAGGMSEEAVALPSLDPVRFATDSAELDAAGWRALQQARDALLRHPQARLLIQAQTDTRAGLPHNRALARRRGQAVVQALLKAGGLDAGRLFLAALPETRLPVLTPDEVDEPANRVVRLSLVEGGGT